MFYVLGTTARSRYREDILRFLAAPMGVTIQARYDKDLVPKKIFENITQAKNKEALVCFVDREIKAAPYPLTPVRYVEIKEANIYGTKVVLSLETKEFAYACDVVTFTREVGKQYEDIPGLNKTPCHFFFESITTTSVEKVARTDLQKGLEAWEKIVDQLFNCHGFQDEPFFWTVLGLCKSNTDLKSLMKLPERVNGRTEYYLPIYHYHPNAKKLNEYLTIKSGGGIKPYSPEGMKIDCRYDLKQPRFKTQPSIYKSQLGWITIGPKGRWELELTIRIRPNFGKYIASFAAAFLGFAIPNVPQVLGEALPTWITWGTIGIGALLVALAVILGTNRSD